MTRKTTLEQTQIYQLLVSAGYPAVEGSLCPLVEGEESQAFSFVADGMPLVVRINPSDTGFLKDAYAANHFAPQGLPIPLVHAVGRYDEGHAYCVSDLLPGTTVQDCPETELPVVTSLVEAIRCQMNGVDISQTQGFGWVNPLTGNGESPTWQAYLEAHYARIDINLLEKHTNIGLLTRLRKAVEKGIAASPSIRCLVHGDFGANNLLYDEGRITGVLDWDMFLYGDPLYDVSGAFVWSFHLPCMREQAIYWRQELLNREPQGVLRLECYQSLLFLQGIADFIVSGRVDWANRMSTHADRVQL